MEFDKLVSTEIINDKIHYVVKSQSEKKIIPNFLIDRSHKFEDLKSLLNGLYIVGDYLDKTILRPNNLSYPNSRMIFLNTFK